MIFQTDPGGAQTQVPSLIHEIKEAGLLVGIYSATDISPEIDGCPVDAYLRDGNVVYADLSTRNPDFTGHGSMDFR